MSRNNRGNIFFVILLAVVLFAALAYAVTSSMRGGGKDGSAEVLKSQVAILQNLQTQYRAALQRMLLVQDLKEWQINFFKAGFTRSGQTANATCSTASCDLHDAGGGGVSPYLLPSAYRQPASDSALCSDGSAGHFQFMEAGIKGVGSDDLRDMNLVYLCPSRALCMAVNDANGIANPNGAPPQFVSSPVGCLSEVYSGTKTSINHSSCPSYGSTPDSVEAAAGKQMFCFTFSSVNANLIIMTLVER